MKARGGGGEGGGGPRLSSRNYGSCHGCSFVDGVFAPRGGCPNHEPRKLQPHLFRLGSNPCLSGVAVGPCHPPPTPYTARVTAAKLLTLEFCLRVRASPELDPLSGVEKRREPLSFRPRRLASSGSPDRSIVLGLTEAIYFVKTFPTGGKDGRFAKPGT